MPKLRHGSLDLSRALKDRRTEKQKVADKVSAGWKNKYSVRSLDDAIKRAEGFLKEAQKRNNARDIRNLERDIREMESLRRASRGK